MLKCRQVAEMASDYNEGQLSPGQRLNLALHLLLCGHCRRFVHQLRVTTAFLRLLPRQRIPEDRAQSICDQTTAASRRREQDHPDD